MTIYSIDFPVRKFKHYFPGITAERINSLNEMEYSQLLMESADIMFDTARYTTRGEMCLEILDIPEVAAVISDKEAIATLTADDRTVFDFWMRLQQFAYPIFKCISPDFSSFPWNFSNTDYSIANKELRSWLCDCPQKNLVAAMLNGMYYFMLNNGGLNQVAQTSVSERLRGIEFKWSVGSRSEEEERAFRVRINETIEQYATILNHNEIGKRLGFCSKEQLLYDAIDSFIYSRYDYPQVDMVKELWAWIGKNWASGKNDHACEEKQAVVDEVHRLADEYGVSLVNEDYTMIVIMEHVLDTDALVSRISEDYEYEDWEEKEWDGDEWDEDDNDEDGNESDKEDAGQ